MTPDIDISVVEDTATPALRDVMDSVHSAGIKRAAGTACTKLLQAHLRMLGPNKRGWPTTHFYEGAARGSGWDVTEEGIEIYCDNERHPGAMRQRYYGGPIRMKDKLLTIPAAAAFYGRGATEFTNLRFVMFGRGGPKALVVGAGGTGRVNFATGREVSVKGAGVRSAGMVAFWLKEEVDQEGDPHVIPDPKDFAEEAIAACSEYINNNLPQGGTTGEQPNV